LMVVNCLVSDVVCYLIEVIVANGKGCVTALPFKEFTGLDFVGNQMGGTPLNLFNHVSYSQSRRESC